MTTDVGPPGSRIEIQARALGWGLALCAGAYVAFEAWLRWPTLAACSAPLLVLGVPAAATAIVVARARSRRTPRLALAFVLAAFALLPPPAALLVGSLAALVGPGAVAGIPRRGPLGLAALLVSLAIGQFYAATLGWPADLAAADTFGRLMMIHVVVNGFALALALTLDLEVRDLLLGHDAPGWRSTLVELCCVPLAWLLAVLLQQGAGLPAAGLALAVVGGQVALAALERAGEERDRARSELARREREVAALAAIGRRILGSLDTPRIFTLVDRECRKLFEVDSSMLALVEPDPGRPWSLIVRRRGGRPECSSLVPAGGLAARLLAEGRPRLLDEAGAAALGGGFPSEAGLRAFLVAPLLVEERGMGLLVLRSRREDAYGERELAAFGALAQQAAVALEHARTYRKATLDSLTGFAQRDYFFQRLAEECRRVQRYRGRLAVLMADLDGFKQINDRHGHLAGDHYLAETAETIRAQLRAADVACRFGGDEFCMLLPETDAGGAQAIAERIREAVARRVVALGETQLRATISIGVASLPEHEARDAQELLRRADEALYRAKRAGRDGVAPAA